MASASISVTARHTPYMAADDATHGRHRSLLYSQLEVGPPFELGGSATRLQAVPSFLDAALLNCKLLLCA